MPAILEITDQSFDSEVLQADGPVLVDFWAPWCGPCRAMEPLLDELAERHGEVKFAKLNVDDNQGTAARFAVLSIPTLMVFQAGEVRKKLIGAMPRKRLLSELGDWLGGAGNGAA